MVDDSSGQALRKARDQFVATLEMTTPVREEIAVSWRRSVLHGLRPDHVEVPYDANLNVCGRFAEAARPVADRLSDDLAGTGVTVLLADPQARVIDRRVADSRLRKQLDSVMVAPGFRHGEENTGTNAIGTALRQLGPTVVAGGEHFADALSALACCAAPIGDPGTGRILGVVGLTSPAEVANPLMLPLIKRTRREIEQRLLQGTSAAGRGLLEQFVQARRRARGPLVAVSEQAMHTNAAAARIVAPADRAMLWNWASRALAGRPHADSELRLTSGLPLVARARAVHDGSVLVGALVRFDQPSAAQPTATRPDGPATGRPAFGWDSLTDTERGVADLITEGMTNRAAAARLFLSHHTIDYHLRQIFRKLGITSRVELTRLVVERKEPGRGAVG